MESLRKKLDLGQREAIVVASEVGAELLLIDEADGRHIARISATSQRPLNSGGASRTWNDRRYCPRSPPSPAGSGNSPMTLGR